MRSLSNGLCVDLVVLLVRANEADIEHLVGIVNPDDQAILVDRNVEDDTSVFQDAGVGILLFHITGRGPIGLHRFAIPRHRRRFGVRVFRSVGPEGFQGRHGDNSHDDKVVPNWDQCQTCRRPATPLYNA